MADIERAADAVTAADPAPKAVLHDWIDDVRTDLERRRMSARLARVETLLEEAIHQTDSRAYTGAYRSYSRARGHVETALVVAVENDFERIGELQEKLDHIETRIDHLTVRPLALAKQARERAQKTEKLEVKTESWQEAFEHYRDALTAGCGTDLDFAGDKEAIRFQLESVVAKLIDARRTLAEQFESTADARREVGENYVAEKQYQKAVRQLEHAELVAKQFRAGNCEAIRDQQDRITDKQRMNELALDTT